MINQIKYIRIPLPDNADERISNANLKIMEDFAIFKQDNELTYCTLKIDISTNNSIKVHYYTTFRYQSPEFNYKEVYDDFKVFRDDNKGDFCEITKITCQDSVYITEFSVHRIYDF